MAVIGATRTARDAAGAAPLARPAVRLAATGLDLAAVVPSRDLLLAGSVSVPALVRAAGPWAGPVIEAGAEAPPVTGFAVMDGLVSRTVTIGRRSTPEFFGTGDVLDAMIECLPDEDVHWQIVRPARLAVLDARFAMAASRWPGLWQLLLRQACARADRLAAHLAALQLSRVEDRVVAVLWQMADRWGRVTSRGVVVPVPLTHEVLGRLVAAKRPTVSLALAELAALGTVMREPDGWLLAPASRGTVAPIAHGA